MWNTFVVNPMLNALLGLYGILGNNFFLAIAVFTVVLRLITLPLNMRQQRSSMRMQEMQPQIQAIQKKYRDNPQKMQEEFQKIGYNPAESLLGCLPLLIQMPILFGLYRAITFLLGSTPQALFDLSFRTADFIDLSSLLPLSNQFIWMNLGQPDPWFVLPVLVFGTTFLQQKLLAPRKPPEDESEKGKKQEEENPMAGMTQSMQVTMPVMFGFMALTFPAGLSLYFILSNLIGIGQGWFIRRSLPEQGGKPKAAAGPVKAAIPEPEPIPAAEPMTRADNGKENAKPKSRARRKSKRKRRRSAKR